MPKRLFVSAATITAAAASAFIALLLPTGTAGASSGIDMSMTGSVVAGVKGAGGGLGRYVTFAFTERNNSSSQTADAAFNFSFKNTTDPGGDFYECPSTTTHYEVSADTPSCEPGYLGAGKATSAAVIVEPNAGVSSMTVKACAQDLNGSTDPVASNNCKSLTIAIQ